MQLDPVSAPPGGWPKTFHSIRVDDSRPLGEVIGLICFESRKRRMEVKTGYRGRELFAYPHQTTDQVRRTFLGLNPGMDHLKQQYMALDIDGRSDVVPFRVWAHVQTLSATIESLTAALERANAAMAARRG